MSADDDGIDNTPDLHGAFAGGGGVPPPAPPASEPWTKDQAEDIRAHLVKPVPMLVPRPGGAIELEVDREAQAKYERDAARLNYIEQARAEKQGTLQRDFTRVKGPGR